MPAQGWHHDADHVFGPELNFVEVFYFPQDTPVELGPTELVPGTHIMPTKRPNEEGGVYADGPAGTIGIHHQSILHRRGLSTGKGRRHMLKYNYWRTTPPQRDWITEPEFDLQGAYYGGHNQARYVAHMFYWCAAKATTSASSAAKPGRGPAPTRSAPPTASAASAATNPTGANKTRTAMPVE